jgi:hypothetical protein
MIQGLKVLSGQECEDFIEQAGCHVSASAISQSGGQPGQFIGLGRNYLCRPEAGIHESLDGTKAIHLIPRVVPVTVLPPHGAGKVISTLPLSQYIFRNTRLSLDRCYVQHLEDPNDVLDTERFDR